MALARRTKIALYAALAAVAATGGIVYALTPEDQKIGSLLRFVLFHGASTWVNLLSFTALAIISIATLFGWWKNSPGWANTLRYMALIHWLINTALGILSSKLAWNQVNWQETRLRLSMWLLLAGLAVLLVHLILERPRLTAALDVVFATVMWSGLSKILLAEAGNLRPDRVHPDSPVFQSGEMSIRFAFFAQAGVVIAATVIIAFLVHDLMKAAHKKGAPGDGDSLSALPAEGA